jgi:hypothetical protein
VGGIREGLGDSELQTRQPDVEESLEQVVAVNRAQVHFRVHGQVIRERPSCFRHAIFIAPMKQADQPAANSCSGLVPCRDAGNRKLNV